MKADEIRSHRLNSLLQKALTGKYNWRQLENEIRGMGVAESTVRSYLKSLQAMLKKMGKIP